MVDIYDDNKFDRSTFLRRGAGLFAGAGLLAIPALGCGSSSSPSATPGATKGPPSKPTGLLTLAVSEAGKSDNLDPATPISAQNRILGGLIYSTLVSHGPGWEVQPQLAESWEPNSDMTEWQFKLRSGVEFHDGKSLTADDVVYSLRRVLDPEVGSSMQVRAARTMTADGIKADGPSAVTISLTQPDALLPHLFCYTNFQIAQAGSKNWGQAGTVGTGPFVLKSWDPGVAWEVEANPNYWVTGLPYLQGVRQIVTTEQTSKVQGVVSGEYHLAEGLDFPSAVRLENDAKVQILRFGNGNSRTIIMDSQQGPFGDRRVRDAFKLLIDREQALSAAYSGFGSVTADIPLKPDDPFFPPGLEPRAYDPEQAASLLKAAGHDKLDLELLFTDSQPGGPEIAQILASSASQIGVNLSLKNWPASTWPDQVWLKKPFYIDFWYSLFPPDNLWWIYASNGPYNQSHIKMPKVDEMFEACLKAKSEDEMREYAQEGHRVVSEDFGHIIPVAAETLYLASSSLKGVEESSAGSRVRLERAYFEE